MINKFLASKFSGYIAIGLVVALGFAAFWLHHKGYTACQRDQRLKDGQAAQAQVRTEIKTTQTITELNRKAREDESTDLDIIRNAINRLP
jgi:hypothetical protein